MRARALAGAAAGGALLAAPGAAAVGKPAPFSGTVRGPVATINWGDVQVTIVVQAGTIVDVRATYPVERPRSRLINLGADPDLRSSALKVQSGRIQLVGGATLTSAAYAASLQGAVDRAHLRGAGRQTPDSGLVTVR